MILSHKLLPLPSQKALQWAMVLRDPAVSLLRQLRTLPGVMWSTTGYVLTLCSASEESSLENSLPALGRKEILVPWSQGRDGAGSYLTLGCVGHSPHRGDHGEGAGRLIGVLLPRDRVIRK